MPQIAHVAATASPINSLDRPAPSFRKQEFIHAPAHACWTYSANGAELTQSAFGHVSTTHRPGGTNCGEPTLCRL